MVKVWSIVNLGNMQIENLFATNWSFQRIRVEKSNTVKLQDDFIIDEETGEIIEQPKKKSRRTEIKHR